MYKQFEGDGLRHHGKIGKENATILTTWVGQGTAEEIDKIAYNNGWSRSATIAAIIERYIANKLKEDIENDR